MTTPSQASSPPPLRNIAIELALLLVGPALLVLTRYFSWGAMPFRFATLCSLALFVAVVCLRRNKLASCFDAPGLGQRLRLPLMAATAVLVAVQAGVFIGDTKRGNPCRTDMGKPSICAGEWLLQQQNPWAECAPKLPAQSKAAKKRAPATTYEWCVRQGRCIDRKGYPGFDHHGPGFDFMDGYKYGPLMSLTYLPATHFLRERGLYLVNFAFWLGLLAVMLQLSAAAYPELPAARIRVLFGFLATVAIPTKLLLPKLTLNSLGKDHHYGPPSPLVFVRELTTTCSNDIIPITLLLAALLLAARKRSGWAGVLLGLSLAAKQVPAPLIGLLMLGLVGVQWKRLLASAVATTTLIYLPFFVWAPREMIANLILFNLARPTNASSIRAMLPASAEVWVSLAQLVVIAACMAYWLRRPRESRDLASLLPIAAVLMVGFVVLNKIVHGNYLVWIQPLVALALAGAPFARTQQQDRA